MKNINLVNICYCILGMILVLAVQSISEYLLETWSGISTLIPSRNFFLYMMMVSIFLLFSYHRITVKHPETKTGLRFLFILLISLSVFMYFIYASDAIKDYQTIISIVFSSILVASWWWVQDIISRTTMRRSHTLNVVMNQRNSEIFSNKVIDCRTNLGFDYIVNEEVVRYYLDKDGRCSVQKNRNANNEELFKKFDNVIASLDSMVYLLNYYEFIAAGMLNKDLDSDLLSKCYLGIVSLLEKRAFWLMYYQAKTNYSKQTMDFSYSHLLKWIKSMSKDGTSIVLNKLDNASPNEPVGTFVFSKEEIDEIFN